MFTKADAEKILSEKSQLHVLKDFDNLSEEKKTEFLKQIENINWADISMIGKETAIPRGKFTVPAAVSIEEIEASKDKFLKAGIESIKKGEVAAVLLAGGLSLLHAASVVQIPYQVHAQQLL